jgi:very-short-patch-repair endonuclease
MRVLENAVSDTSPQRGEAGRGEKHAWDPTPVPLAILHAARDLRQHMTDAEHCLWQCLRGQQRDGFRFRKQHPIERFVLDCSCSSVKLTMEIDRAQHRTSPGRASDEERTRGLNARGIRMLRFWHREVWQDLPGVFQRVWEALYLPPSSPPPRWGKVTCGGHTAREDDTLSLLILQRESSWCFLYAIKSQDMPRTHACFSVLS